MRTIDESKQNRRREQNVFRWMKTYVTPYCLNVLILCTGRRDESMTSWLLPLRACLAIPAIATAAVLVLVSPVAAVSCLDLQEETSASGFFTGTALGQKTRLVLEGNVKIPEYNMGLPGCVLRFEGGDAAGLGDLDGATIVGICRDASTGRDHAVVHSSAGQYHDIQVWAAGPGPAAGPPLMLYSEAWGEGVYGEWGLDLLIAADGTCRWRERQEDSQTFKAAMAALRIGASPDANLSEFGLPTRLVPAAAVRRWLTALKGAAALEGAVYADDAGRTAWLVVQVLGWELCNAEGVVLLFDRRRQLWRTIYDVPSGCSKQLNYPMGRMVVKGDRLFASLCYSCIYWGDRRDYVIDLYTFHAAALDWRDRPVLPDGHANPELRWIDGKKLVQPGP